MPPGPFSPPGFEFGHFDVLVGAMSTILRHMIRKKNLCNKMLESLRDLFVSGPGMQMQEHQISSSTCSQGERSSVSHYIYVIIRIYIYIHITYASKNTRKQTQSQKRIGVFLMAFFRQYVSLLGLWGCMYVWFRAACLNFPKYISVRKSRLVSGKKNAFDSNFHQHSYTKTHPTFLTLVDLPF